jgi:hypothetical protein
VKRDREREERGESKAHGKRNSIDKKKRNRRGSSGDDQTPTSTSAALSPQPPAPSSSSPAASPRRRQELRGSTSRPLPPVIAAAVASSATDGGEQQQQQQQKRRAAAAKPSFKARDSAFGEQDDRAREEEEEEEGEDETAALAATHRRNAAAAAAATAAATAHAAPASLLPLSSGAGGTAPAMTTTTTTAGYDDAPSSSAAFRTPLAALRVALPGAPSQPSSDDELNGILGERRWLRGLSSFQRALTLVGVLALGVLGVVSFTRKHLLLAEARSSQKEKATGIAPFPLFALYFQPLLLASLMLWLWAGCVAWFEASGTRYDACFSARDRRRLPRSEALARGKKKKVKKRRSFWSLDFFL